MRLFLDHNLSFRLCERLADVFPDMTNAAREGMSLASDQELWDHARARGYAIVTQDADFADLATLHGPPPKVIWLRGGNRSTRRIEALLRRAAGGIEAFGEDAEAACLELW